MRVVGKTSVFYVLWRRLVLLTVLLAISGTFELPYLVYSCDLSVDVRKDFFFKDIQSNSTLKNTRRRRVMSGEGGGSVNSVCNSAITHAFPNVSKQISTWDSQMP
jgi:hypothetical protein